MSAAEEKPCLLVLSLGENDVGSIQKPVSKLQQVHTLKGRPAAEEFAKIDCKFAQTADNEAICENFCRC